MTKATETATLPTFDSIAVDTLPAATRSSDAETVALGNAILAAMKGGNAALDPTSYATRKDAGNRATALKRAVRAADKSATISQRIYAEGDAWRVAILHAAPSETPTETAETGETTES